MLPSFANYLAIAAVILSLLILAHVMPSLRMPPADADINRKRPSEGGPEDAARPHKRRSHGAPAMSSNPASSEERDPPALTSLADGSRRYDEFKGDIGKLLLCAFLPLGQVSFERAAHTKTILRRRCL